MRLKIFHPFARQNIGSVLLAGMKFYCNFAVNAFIDEFVKLNEMCAVDIFCKINFRRTSGVIFARNIFTADNRSLICHLKFLLNFLKINRAFHFQFQ